ncbi:FadR/GntR family transcriptional regulator [Stagnihabitans tardus]|uniref:FCD domain-containing protein n=1 Tax=Stagnihabitans tardus TaxID=2699202 RepID=A0AAE4YBY5_9RHOB|nr:FCD domain-containing protein [Stagnihabitans tardus]NBZ89154.1 FCD domain-containing protein [Stagnihabitans tardus]
MPAKAPLHYLNALEAKSRGDAVMDALAAMIEDAGLTVGDRLPPEVLLAEKLNVGRSTIREVLNRWEALGIIRRRRGDGTYLMARVHSSKGPVPLSLRLSGEALLKLLDVRRTLEIEVCRRAALNASPAQRLQIKALCKTLVDLVDAGAPWHKADAAFHGAIYDASGNPMFGQILHRLDEALIRGDESPFGRDDFGLASFPLHHPLADAIVAADPDAAEAAVTAMLRVVADEVQAIIDGR